MPEEELKTFEVTLEDGTTVEAVSKADLDAKTKAYEELEAKLKGEEDKDKNFKAVRSAKELAEAEKGELKARLDAIEAREKQKDEQYQKRSDAELEEMLDTVSDGDEETKKRIKFEYDQLSGSTLSKEDRVLRAVRLSRDESSPNPIARAASVQGYGFIKEKKTDFSETDKGKNVANALGIQIEPTKK